MTTTIVERVTARFIESQTTKNAAVVHRAPDGTAWGWVPPGFPRMHLRLLNPKPGGECIVWLEVNGIRSFVPDAGDVLPSSAIEELHTWVTDHRSRVERRWVDHIARQGWLKLDAYGIGIETTAYPDTPGQIQRDIDLRGYPGVLTDDDVSVVDGMLVLGKPPCVTRLSLNRLIWKGLDDGSDGSRRPVS